MSSTKVLASRKVTDLVGNTLTYSASGVVHSAGIGITFEHDTAGRIRALLPDGNHAPSAASVLGRLFS